ncbi:KH_1 domain-containing protein [Cephalotus follicularis]|uniref:KH_1 domain-containing protein n=1 Tax=Cephalotus follicularis TaxID=3775 RepID=A0A1Q3BDB5_CEPFO|nr:KH_1 domain-containing protein [Cephalotus follicularis]
MSAKVDQKSVVESRGLKMSVTGTSMSSASGPKVSMFAAKSGFVIPKNKLLGSMVPVLRGGKKPGGDDASKEESTKQVKRKTKWGPDLTQDAAIRKGRALAYQTRVDQIAQQLKSGILEVGDNRDSPIAAQLAHRMSSSPQVDDEKSEFLELERREAIGEIVKLNPSYKVPADYKPLMKEATVPMPITEYPKYNFVGLIFGPGSETQKRLEKETGAKIKVCGTKANIGGKVEVSPSDGNEIQDVYEELHVHVSADTYEKVDAAVALIELLFTSVADNLAAGSTPTSVSGDNVNAPSQGQEVTIPSMPPAAVINQGVVQSVVRPAQIPSQGQFQYPGQWSQAGPPQNPVPPGFFSHPNSSTAIINNHMHAQSFPFSPSDMPLLFGPRPTPIGGFDLNLQSLSIVPPRVQPPIQVLQTPFITQTHSLGHTAGPSNPSLLGPVPPSSQPNNSAPYLYTGGQPPPSRLVPQGRPLMSSFPQSVSSGPTQGSAVPQHGVVSSAAPLNISSARTVLPVTFPYPALSAPLHSTAISVHAPAPAPIQSSSSIISVAPSSALQSGIPNLVSGNLANFTSIRPPAVTTPRSQHPSYADFTFHRHPPPNLVSQTVPRPLSQPVTQITQSPIPIVQLPASQVPPFRLTVPNSTQPHLHAYPGPQIGNQISQPQALISPPFGRNPTPMSALPRLPGFENSSMLAPTTTLSQMGPRTFTPANNMPNVVGPFTPRPGNPMQGRQENLMAPNQRFSSSHPFASSMSPSLHYERQQIYDPFSPTSVSIASQQQGGNFAVRNQENDPEYDDLMASVGVK